MLAHFKLIVLLTLGLTACGGGDGSSGGSETNLPAGRPSNTSCLAGAAVSYSTIIQRNAFANLTFSQPLAMIPAPSGNQLYVVERTGTVRAFDNSPGVSTTTLFADISSRVSTSGEGGLLGMAFDPSFDTNGYVYFSYTGPISAGESGALWSYISRFVTNPARTVIDPGSEVVLLKINQPFANHNGGHIAFDTNGYLFIGIGDGGSGNDPLLNGQDVTTLLGTMLRIDPSSADTTRGLPYSIPASNPFSANASCANGGCPEIFAWGLRNPWRWSIDRTTNQIWLGDVGQVNREEVDLIEVGRNYGWGCYEGSRLNTEYTGTCPGNLVHELPIHEYPRTDGTSITGGYVYRGNDIPFLRGQYIFADFGSSQVWALSDPYSNPQRTTLLSSNNLIVSMAEDANGELYLVYIDTGRIFKLEPDPDAIPVPPFASQLSQTGCADLNDPKLSSSGMIPYELNAPLWSDNADKLRWLALPDNTNINIGNDHDWTFPIGSVLRKDFVLNGTLVETRLLARHTDGSWAGYSYEWNTAQTDATLLIASKTVNVNGQNWTYPSQSQCLQCHTAAAGQTLGPETAQLNRLITDPNDTASQINQISYLDNIGLFNTSPDQPGSLPQLFEYDDVTAPPADIARSYLHSNCSHCHRAGGPVQSNMDLHYAVDFSAMNICNAPPVFGNVLGATQLFNPNNSSDSILYQRMLALSATDRMPTLAAALEDNQGLQIISNWITSISACP